MGAFVRVWLPNKGLTDVPVTRYDATSKSVFVRMPDIAQEVMLSLASFDLFNDYTFIDEQGNAISSEEVVNRMGER